VGKLQVIYRKTVLSNYPKEDINYCVT